MSGKGFCLSCELFNAFLDLIYSDSERVCTFFFFFINEHNLTEGKEYVYK